VLDRVLKNGFVVREINHDYRLIDSNCGEKHSGLSKEGQQKSFRAFSWLTDIVCACLTCTGGFPSGLGFSVLMWQSFLLVFQLDLELIVEPISAIGMMNLLCYV
jgi:hypothetical protein